MLEGVELKVNEDIYYILSQITGIEGVKSLEDGKTIKVEGELTIKNCTLVCELEPADMRLFEGIQEE